MALDNWVVENWPKKLTLQFGNYEDRSASPSIPVLYLSLNTQQAHVWVTPKPPLTGGRWVNISSSGGDIEVEVIGIVNSSEMMDLLSIQGEAGAAGSEDWYGLWLVVGDTYYLGSKTFTNGQIIKKEAGTGETSITLDSTYVSAPSLVNLQYSSNNTRRAIEDSGIIPALEGIYFKFQDSWHISSLPLARKPTLSINDTLASLSAFSSYYYNIAESGREFIMTAHSDQGKTPYKNGAILSKKVGMGEKWNIVLDGEDQEIFEGYVQSSFSFPDNVDGDGAIIYPVLVYIWGRNRNNFDGQASEWSEPVPFYVRTVRIEYKPNTAMLSTTANYWGATFRWIDTTPDVQLGCSFNSVYYMNITEEDTIEIFFNLIVNPMGSDNASWNKLRVYPKISGQDRPYIEKDVRTGYDNYVSYLFQNISVVPDDLIEMKFMLHGAYTSGIVSSISLTVRTDSYMKTQV